MYENMRTWFVLANSSRTTEEERSKAYFVHQAELHHLTYLATAIRPTGAIDDVDLARNERKVVVDLLVALRSRQPQPDCTRTVRPGLTGPFDGTDPLIVAQVVDDFNIIDIIVRPWTPIGHLGQVTVLLMRGGE